MGDEYLGQRVPQAHQKIQPPPQAVFSHRFTPVPVEAATDERFNTTLHAVITLVSAASREKGWCLLTYNEIAAALHRHRTTISKALRKLARMGYLEEAHSAYDAEHERKIRTVYRLQEPHRSQTAAPTTPSAPTEEHPQQSSATYRARTTTTPPHLKGK